MAYHAKKMIAYLITAALFSASPRAMSGDKKTVEVKNLTSIEVLLTIGAVELMAWNGDRITIERLKAAVPISVEQGVLKIGKGGDSPSAEVGDSVKIYAPPHLLVNVTTVSASVSIQGFGNRVQIQTVSGDTRVSSCSAPLEIETVSGSIDVRDVKGDVSLKTVSGEIRGRQIKAALIETKSVSGAQYLEEVSTRQLRTRSHSGEIEFEGTVPDDGFWESSTFSGEMEFTFNPGASLDLEAQSRSGKVKVDGEVVPREKAENYFRGRMGAGKSLVRLTSFSGKIDVRIEH